MECGPPLLPFQPRPRGVKSDESVLSRDIGLRDDSGRRACKILAVPLLLLLTGAAPLASLDIQISGLRSAKGVVRICLTAIPARFPDCARDPEARLKSLPATAAYTRFDGIQAGSYAVALFHDENGNGRLDKFVGIPREGIGFSNNPRLQFSPPKFNEARLSLDLGNNTASIRMKYYL